MTKDAYLALADSVISRLQNWLDTPQASREEQIPEGLFRGALRTSKAIRDEVRENRKFAKGMRGFSMTRAFGDEFDHLRWPQASRIVKDVETLEKEYDNIS